MDRKIATFENLQKRNGVQTAWLSDLDDCEDLVEILGGDVCVRGYTAQEWDRWREFMTFDMEGNPTPDDRKARFAQLSHCIRTGPELGDPPLFPDTPVGMSVADGLSPHVVMRLVRISDELSGWKVMWDPFFNRRRGREKPTSVGG